MQPQQRQYPTLTLGTAYLIPTAAVAQELVQLSTHIDGDTRNYTDRLEATNSDAVLVELIDAYPSERITFDDTQHTPRIDDWDDARIVISPAEQQTTAYATVEHRQVDPEHMFEGVISHSDLEHTLTRYEFTELIPVTNHDGTADPQHAYSTP